VTIAGRFQTALVLVDEPTLAGPELLPVRLALATARTLRVDGAGICLADAAAQPVPLGASSDDAAHAERLQFTVGEGPCTTAQQTGQPVFALEADLRRRWPGFSDLLLGDTPFRAVVALPLQFALPGAGALDLFFERPDEVTGLDVFEALAVGQLITSVLGDAAVSSESPADGPEWLHGPASRQRAAVWEALGRVGIDLDIDPPSALMLLRARAYGSNRSVDDVAADLLAGRLWTEELRPGGDE
jgi:hypothetical protein